jgi:branched-chain amino acid transport system substrate-binding protein
MKAGLFLVQLAITLMSIVFSVFETAHSEKVRLGVVSPLSGPVAPMGQAFQRGFELYMDKNKDHNLEIIFEDHRYDGKASISALHKMREKDAIDIAVVWGNTPAGSSAPVAQQLKLPLITVSHNPNGKDRPYVTNLGHPMELIMQHVYEKFLELKTKNPGTLAIDIGNATLAVEMLKEKFSGKLTTKSVANDESDFKTIITQLKSSGVDSLMLITFNEQSTIFMRQAKAMGYAPRIIAADVFADQKMQDLALELGFESYLIYGAVESSFIQELSEKYKDTSYFFETASAYSIAAIADRASRDKSDGWNPITSLEKVSLGELPLTGLHLVNTPETGRSFEALGKIYKLGSELGTKK